MRLRNIFYVSLEKRQNVRGLSNISAHMSLSSGDWLRNNFNIGCDSYVGSYVSTDISHQYNLHRKYILSRLTL